MDGEILSDIFDDSEFCPDAANLSPADDIFSVLEAWENGSEKYSEAGLPASRDDGEWNESFEFQKSAFQESENEVDAPKCKRQKLSDGGPAACGSDQVEERQQRISHITVERNRRKQMNEHLSVLRSLMPFFYVKRGDQASIIGGVVDYINELQQLLQSLESKKQRKAYADVLSPRLGSSPRPSALSPRKPPLSPRLSSSLAPISPRTPQTSSPYKPFYLNSPSTLSSPRLEYGLPSPACSSSTSSADAVNELVASSKSAVAEVEVKFAGANLMLKTVSRRIPGQVVKIVSALEELDLEILQVNISNVDHETILSSFTIKIGIECQLSAEELAQQIQQTFC